MATDLFPQTQRDNLTSSFEERIKRTAEDNDIALERAFDLVALDTLGFSADSNEITDGKGDFGIDFIDVQANSASIFQFKSHEFTDHINVDFRVEPTHLTDLPRIHALISDLDKKVPEANSKLQARLRELKNAIERHSKTDKGAESPYVIDVYFVALAKSFSSQAASEFALIEGKSKATWGSHQIALRYYPIFLDDLLAERWREVNAEWRTSDGKKDDSILLHVSGEMITTPKSLVFFAHATDLINAFDKFGYQIFEPNVRCELKRSRVNEAIRDSIATARGRREFRHLNNGITLICAGFRKKSSKDGTEIIVRQPGVINGLQTVKSIHDAYDELQSEGRRHFEENCDVLVRLHTRDAVQDYRELVKSTNNQNPMQPRNLRSNDQEQLDFERLFAEMGWFFERKEGAWQAYKSDHSLWGSLKGYKSSSFISPKTGQVRNVDNLDLSQAWLSFLGFSDQAIHNKREIFVDDRYYNAVFRKRIAKHGYEYDFKFLSDEVQSDAVDQAPSPHALLLSYLLYETANELTPSRKQNRDDAVKRLKLDKQKKEQQDAALSEDPVYIKGLVLAGAKYLFAEFFGLLLFKIGGHPSHDVCVRVLNSESMLPVFQDLDSQKIRDTVRDENYKPQDVVAIAWALYNFCLEQMISIPAWKQEFQQAAVRSRFNYSDFNRRHLFKQLEELDKVYQKRAVVTAWSQGFEQSKGIFSSFKNTLVK